jgi:hemerythrin-like domain-containing protein
MKPTEDLINEHNAIRTMLGIMSKIAENINEGKAADTDDVEKIIGFLKTFADKCHHGKEETALFPALVEAGIPKENGPVGVMLSEHVTGRGYIKDMELSNSDVKAGKPETAGLLAGSMLNYVNLLQNHIQKEENILFRMADRVLSAQVQDDIYRQFEHIEEEVVGHGIHEQFHELLHQLKDKYSVQAG